MELLALHVKVVNVCVTVVQITTCLLFHMLAAVKTLGNGVVAISEVMSITGTKALFPKGRLPQSWILLQSQQNSTQVRLSPKTHHFESGPWFIVRVL